MARVAQRGRVRARERRRAGRTEIWPRADEALAAVGALAPRRTGARTSSPAASSSASASRRRSRCDPRSCSSTSRPRSSTPTARTRFLARGRGARRGGRALGAARRRARSRSPTACSSSRAGGCSSTRRATRRSTGSPSTGPRYAPARGSATLAARRAEPVCTLDGVSFAYRPALPVLDGVDARGPPRRGRRARRARTARARRRSRRSPPACSSRTPGTVERGAAAPATSRRIRAATSSASASLDEVALARRRRSRRARGRRSTRVGLGWAADRHPRDLSSGERERLGLAAVAVAEPDLLVLDEPTRGVDPDRKAALAEWLVRVRRRGTRRARRHARPRRSRRTAASRSAPPQLEEALVAG